MCQSCLRSIACFGTDAAGEGNRKLKSLGTFNTAIQAALAYDQAAIKAGKKKSTLNFPDGLPIKQESDIDDSEGFWV